MDETAIYDYKYTYNRWCKAKKPSLMRGRGIPIHTHSTTGFTF
jgi:hypothetical protein